MLNRSFRYYFFGEWSCMVWTGRSWSRRWRHPVPLGFATPLQQLLRIGSPNSLLLKNALITIPTPKAGTTMFAATQFRSYVNKPWFNYYVYVICLHLWSGYVYKVKMSLNGDHLVSASNVINSLGIWHMSSWKAMSRSSYTIHAIDADDLVTKAMIWLNLSQVLAVWHRIS